MPSGQPPKNRFSCPHCGAVYDVRIRRDGKREYHTAVCSYCGDVMAEWQGTPRHYHRLKRPPDKLQLAKSIVADAHEAATDTAVCKPQPARKRSRATAKPVAR